MMDDRRIRLRSTVMYFEAIRWALGLTDGTPLPHPLPSATAPK